MKRKTLLIAGLVWLAFLCGAYAVPVQTEAGSNSIVKDTLLGIVIFHSPFVFGLYILADAVLIATWSTGTRIQVALEQRNA